MKYDIDFCLLKKIQILNYSVRNKWKEGIENFETSNLIFLTAAS